ncbi:hypothetical protein [Legionella spiritensis]|uniref:hypothetical protein n=1 Tax=Legionella spiritensis TaxID=452 RepID=UPI000F81F5DC|nr:hypothetical protein [Legionella spiritensis]
MEDKTEKVTESEFDRALLACLVIFSKEAARINGKEIFNVNFLKLFQFLAEGDDVNDLNELERKYEQILFPDGQNRPYGDQVFFHEIIKNHRLDEDKTVVSYLNRYKEELSLPNLMVQWPAKKLWSLSLFRPAQNKTCCPVKEELQSCAASSAEMQHSKISTGKEKSHSFFNVQPQPEHSTQQDDFANHQKLR